MIRWKCYYRVPTEVRLGAGQELQIYIVDDNPDVLGLERVGAFIDGFFLNENRQLVERGDPEIKYWMPPSSIVQIEQWEDGKDLPEPEAA